MRRTKRSSVRKLILLATITCILASTAKAATINVDCGNGEKLQPKVLAAKPGDTILVSGTCRENVLVPEQITNITLDGQGKATVSGTNLRSSSFFVTGRGITIQGFTVTGANNGILVNRGGTAIIVDNTIRETGGNGVQINQHATARVVDNRILNNPSNGIQVNEASFARIGSFLAQQETPQANTIEGNGGYGIYIRSSSSAVIVGNNITNNKRSGIGITQVSHALISANRINRNSEDGILVRDNSGVNMGAKSGARLRARPNQTTNDNGGFGIRCLLLSSATGRLGNLNGSEGAKSFTSGCVDDLIP